MLCSRYKYFANLEGKIQKGCVFDEMSIFLILNKFAFDILSDVRQ